MMGMVLAAGAGRRLRPYTDGLPKALVPVDGDTTILDIALRNMTAVDLRDIVVVVGYAADAVEARRVALERRHGVSLTLLHNDRAEEWNNAYSLWLARGCFAGGTLFVNGDTVHPVAVEEALLERRDPDGPGVVLAVDDVKPLGDEEMKVQLGAEGAVRHITKLMDPRAADGEYIGAALVRPGGGAALARALEVTWQRDPGLYYEDGFQELVDGGGTITTAAIGAVPWVEVDDHDDLRQATEIAREVRPCPF